MDDNLRRVEYIIEIANPSSDPIDVNLAIPFLPMHPFILHPTKCIRLNKSIIQLVYDVSRQGMTLRSFVEAQRRAKKEHSLYSRMSSRLLHTAHLDPIPTMMRLIDGYEQLIEYHVIVGHSTVNPDCIWIEPDQTGRMCSYVINTMESYMQVSTPTAGFVDNNISVSSLSDRTFWPPEILGKYNHRVFFSDGEDERTIARLTSTIRVRPFNRSNTRSSAITIVYSLGLVMFYMITKSPPFDGTRLDVDERPAMCMIENSRHRKIIEIAINADPKHRPTLAEFRDIINPANIDFKQNCVIL